MGTGHPCSIHGALTRGARGVVVCTLGCDPSSAGSIPVELPMSPPRDSAVSLLMRPRWLDSTRGREMPHESAGVDARLSIGIVGIETPMRRDSSQAMVANRFPSPEDSVRFAGELLIGRVVQREDDRFAPGKCEFDSRRVHHASLARRSSTPLVSARCEFDSRGRLKGMQVAEFDRVRW